SVTASRTGTLEESAHSEPVPLKNRMAVYQAAVSKQDRTGFSSSVMEEAEVCSLPGGLASVRRQFENEGMSSSHMVTQIHHTHRSVQEVSNSSAMSVASSSGGRQVSQQVFLQDERAAHDQIAHNREVISGYENHHSETEEEEYYPRLSTKELAQHFEKTIEEAAPSKKIKQYYRQRELSELKRLCKHIHPDVRKDLEKEFYDDEGIEAVGEVQEAAYQFEHTGSNSNGSPDREYLEWDEILRGEVQSVRWMFENKPLDCIKDDSDNEEDGKKIIQQDIIPGGDVKNRALMFETQPMDTLGLQCNSAKQNYLVNEVGKRDVRAAAWLFETKPMDTLNKIHTDDEQTKEVIFTQEATEGDVKSVRYMFENQEMDSLGDTETMDEKQLLSLKSVLEEIKSEVKKVIWMFETQCMCVMREHSGEMVLITSVRREETEKGDVKTSRWLFETQSLNDIDMDLSQVRLISSISLEDNQLGDAKRGRWLFETKRLDSINAQWERMQKQRKEEIFGADVRKHCMVFETQPMDTLKDDANSRPVTSEQIIGGNVRSVRHLFENAPPDEVKELPENKPLENIKDEDDEVNRLKKTIASDEERGDDDSNARPVSAEEILGGDVQSARHFFETAPKDEMKELAEVGKLKRMMTSEEKGDVRHQKWLFESQPLEQIREERKEITRTYDESQKIQVEGVTTGSVRSNKNLFESMPLYALQDSSGHYHEGITQQEIESGDVKTAKWLFETQPLDAIKYFSNIEDEECVRETAEIVKDMLYEREELKSTKDSGEVQKENLENISGGQREDFKSVTEIDIQSGDVSRMKYIFETQSSDVMSSTSEDFMRQLRSAQAEDIQKGNVGNCKWLFENQPIDKIIETPGELKGAQMRKLQKVIREDEEKGDVKTFAMMFETQPLYAIQDKEGHYHEVTTLTKEDIHREEDIQKGDVSSARWRFETQPLDKIAEDAKITIKTVEDIQGGDVKTNKQRFESDALSQKLIHAEKSEDEMKTVVMEEQLKGDVKQSVWLFEKNPLDHVNESDESKKVICEEIPKADVKTTTWLFETTPFTEFNESSLEKTEIIGKSVKATLNELFTQRMVDNKGIIIEADEIGDVRMAKYNLMNKEAPQIQREEIIKGDLQNIMMNLLNRQEKTERAIVINAEERGDISGAVHQLLQEHSSTSVEKEEIIRGDIQEAINNLLKEESTGKRGILIQEDEKGDVHTEEIVRIEVDEAERGKVEPDEANPGKIEKEEIIGGDIKGTKLSLTCNQAQIGRLVDREDIREEVVKGDLQAVMNSLTQSVNQTVVLEKEEVIRADLPTTLRSLEEAQNQPREVEKPEIIPEDLVPGDIKGTLKSLEEAKHEVREVEKEEIGVQGDVKGKIQLLLEPPPSPRMQRRASTEGDVKLSIKSLYDTQEQVLSEKEEVIKGDVKGTIKSLMETAERASPTIPRRQPIRKRSAHKQSMQNKYASHESTAINTHTTACSQETETTVLEHKTIVQTHGVKTLKTDFRNLKKSGCKGISFPTPPPSIRAKTELDHLPPPPTPPPPPLAMADLDLLPPPPTEQELDLLPLPNITPSKPTKMTVKPVKAPTLCKPPESPRPPKKVFAPLMLTPPASPPPPSKSPSSQGSSGQQQTTSTSAKKKKKRSVTTNIQQDVSSIFEDKTKEESSPKKNQEQNSPDRSLPIKEIQIKDAEQKPQKADSQKAKKVSKSAKLESKEKATAEQENVQVKESREKSPTETENKVEKEAKEKPVEGPPATPKKKRRSKSKKDREAAQSNNAASISPTEATSAEPKWPVLTSEEKQEEITVVQTQHTIQTAQTEVYKEVIKTESKSAQKETAESSVESATSLRQAEAQKMLSRISELQGVAGKMDSKSVKTLLNEMPVWLLGPEEKTKLMHFDGAIEKHECEATSEKLVSSGAIQRISKISIGSTKCETQKVVKEETKTTRKSRKQQMSSVTTLDPRAPSPLLRLRSPSPTFITIESTKRTDSPQRAAPSPSLTPPMPPPRKSETPSSRLSRASPSPSSSRADSLTRLRNATATLSRGASPDPIKIDSKHVEEGTLGSSETQVVTVEVNIANDDLSGQAKTTEMSEGKDIKNVFEMSEQSSFIKEQQNKQEEQESRLSSPLLVRKDVKEDKIIGSRSTTAVSTQSQSVTTQRVPFSYADAVKKKTSEVTVSPEASAEELMKNFHKTWTESESVFKSLGVTGERAKPRTSASDRDCCAG
ncbi:hypothetical protein cypCar_00036571, partial [Cyprinus carpio]